jgi:hypothetical protein
VRYRMGEKRRYVDQLLAILVEELPYRRVRSAF